MFKCSKKLFCHKFWKTLSNCFQVFAREALITNTRVESMRCRVFPLTQYHHPDTSSGRSPPLPLQGRWEEKTSPDQAAAEHCDDTDSVNVALAFTVWESPEAYRGHTTCPERTPQEGYEGRCAPPAPQPRALHHEAALLLLNITQYAGKIWGGFCSIKSKLISLNWIQRYEQK